MFLKVKLKPNGDFDKLKARLVADGSTQDKNMYEDVSSPTMSTTSLFVLTALAARDKLHVSKIDIASAYLNADMTGPRVYMKFDPEIATILTQLESKLVEYITDNGAAGQSAVRVRLKRGTVVRKSQIRTRVDGLCDKSTGPMRI